MAEMEWAVLSNRCRSPRMPDEATRRRPVETHIRERGTTSPMP